MKKIATLIVRKALYFYHAFMMILVLTPACVLYLISYVCNGLFGHTKINDIFNDMLRVFVVELVKHIFKEIRNEVYYETGKIIFTNEEVDTTIENLTMAELRDRIKELNENNKSK